MSTEHEGMTMLANVMRNRFGIPTERVIPVPERTLLAVLESAQECIDNRHAADMEMDPETILLENQIAECRRFMEDANGD